MGMVMVMVMVGRMVVGIERCRDGLRVNPNINIYINIIFIFI